MRDLGVAGTAGRRHREGEVVGRIPAGVVRGKQCQGCIGLVADDGPGLGQRQRFAHPQRERQDDELRGDLRSALVTDEQQLLVTMRKIRQVECVLDGELPVYIRGQANQGLSASPAEVHFDLLARYEVLPGEPHHRIRRRRVGVEDDPRREALDVEPDRHWSL